jgi:hypothetical protein
VLIVKSDVLQKRVQLETIVLLIDIIVNIFNHVPLLHESKTALTLSVKLGLVCLSIYGLFVKNVTQKSLRLNLQLLGFAVLIFILDNLP